MESLARIIASAAGRSDLISRLNGEQSSGMTALQQATPRAERTEREAIRWEKNYNPLVSVFSNLNSNQFAHLEGAVRHLGTARYELPRHAAAQEIIRQGQIAHAGGPDRPTPDDAAQAIIRNGKRARGELN